MSNLSRYLTAWHNLRRTEVGASTLADSLGIENLNSAKVIISRMRDDYMLYSPHRSTHILVDPSFWIRLQELKESYKTEIPSSLLNDLARNSEKIKAIILHGSRIRGDYKWISDIDMLILSEEDLAQIKNKVYPHGPSGIPIDIEIQPTVSYDKLFVKKAIEEGVIVYDDGVIEEMKNSKVTKSDYDKALAEIEKVLFQLDDERLRESLPLRDLAHLIYSTYRRIQITEESLRGETTTLPLTQKILDATHDLYQLAKVKENGIPQISRQQLESFRKALIDRWAELKGIIDT